MSDEHDELRVHASLDRRDFLRCAALGLGAWSARHFGAPARLPFPRARRAIHISVCGGISHLDTFDYKPALDELHGKPMPASERLDPFFAKVGLLRRSDWAFSRRGQSGLWVSDLLPHIASVADLLTVVRSMVAETANHVPAKFQENTGFTSTGFPALGSWLSYGLGPIARDLPAYVVLTDERGAPAGGAANWSSGFLPCEHGGVILRNDGTAVPHLLPDRALDPSVEAGTQAILAELNAGYRRRNGSDRDAVDRDRAHALAARMQRALPEATDLADESSETHLLYGTGDPVCRDLARSCLLGRRLLERGVRFVQVFVGGPFGSPRINWDGHEDMVANHAGEARRMDRPVAGLLADLAQRGMLEDTLVLCTTEFGRSPYTQAEANTVGRGRDHNEKGFTVWLAGAGLRPGVSYGETDELGYRAVRDPVAWADLHATVLWLFGIDHERLTYYHDGISRRLTNVGGRVVTGILA